MNKFQDRNGIAPELAEERRFFELYGSGKSDTPKNWNIPENWLDLDDIPENAYFGFAIGNDSNYLLIDGDHVRDPASGQLVPWVNDVVKRLLNLSDTYTEISKSGTGFHMIVDLGEYGDNFEPETNADIQKIVAMDPMKYTKLPEKERDKTPKIELFYHARGRYVYLTGKHAKGEEPKRVARDEDAAAIFSELIKIREEFHARYAEDLPVTSGEQSKVIVVDDSTREKILQALPYISATERETWVTVGIALYRCGFDYEVWDEWSKWDDQRNNIPCDKYDPKDAATVWKSFKNTKSRWNAGTIFIKAREAGWRKYSITTQQEQDLPAEPDSQDDFWNLMQRTQEGALKNTFYNYVMILKHDPFFKGHLQLNALSGRTEIDGFSWEIALHPLREVDLNNIRLHISNQYYIDNKTHCLDAILTTAATNRYHPVVDRLNKLVWDGKPRIAELFPKYLGAQRSEYTTAVTTLLLNAAIERVFHPGIKFDTCIILADKKQGTGKSSMCRFLALDDAWFTDQLKDMGKLKEAYETIRGKWVVELGEMVAARKTDTIEEIKGYLSRLYDDYREPYSKISEQYPRQCVFVGTTNRPAFLPQDPTGNRRFIPVLCDGSQAEVHPMKDEQETRAYIMQCYAEALEQGRKNGFSLVLDEKFNDEIDAVRSESTPEDSRIGIIQAWLDDAIDKEGNQIDFVCSRMIYDKALAPSNYKSPTQYELTDIANIMALNITGWQKCKTKKRFTELDERGRSYGVQRAWQRVATSVATDADFVAADGADIDNPFL